jgi:Chitobiase/beta-hexosaminidase C-terminal domain
MKTVLFVVSLLLAATFPASAISITTPANGAQVTSPFNLVASTATCASKAAVSMGYSIDSGSAIIEPTSFSALVTASVGTHVLHVKCWGQQVSDQEILNITVVPPSPIVIASPAKGAQLTSPFIVSATAQTCGSVPAVSMGYSIDSGPAVIEPTSFSASATASVGTHMLHVKCWGQKASAEILENITVVPQVTATPMFLPAAGTYASKQSVTVSVATPSATIYYTTDGSAPSTASARYAGPIAVTKSAVIQAIAVAPSYQSSGMARADYVIVPPPSGPTVPSNAISVKQVQLLPNWRIKHDPATPGTANGSMSLVSDPSLSGEAAQFDTNYTSWGGVLYSQTYGVDPNAHNFLYDGEVWIEAGSSIGNLEMDNNQVIADGDTVIYAFQCAGDTNTWDYSENAGTPAAPVVKWVPSKQPCNPAQWTPNAWHHVQITYSRDDVGNVTYQSVWLDGVEAPINETVPSAFTLGWAAGDLVSNFQVDGPAAGGSSTLYLDDLTIYRW